MKYYCCVIVTALSTLQITLVHSYSIMHSNPIYTNHVQIYFDDYPLVATDAIGRQRRSVIVTKLFATTTSLDNPEDSTVKTADASVAVSASNSVQQEQEEIILNVEKYYPIILFDGVCNFCNVWVDLLLRIDSNGVYKLTPLQSPIGQHILQTVCQKDRNDISSIVLVDTNRQYYVKSDCVLQVVKQLGLPFQLASTILQNTIPIQFRDIIYDTVAENRYNILGKRDVCRSGDPIYFDRFVS